MGQSPSSRCLIPTRVINSLRATGVCREVSLSGGSDIALMQC